ncbi:hypothetical protein M065_2726 [Bacteroides fragilis str. Korea 419]|nr:hypothetical protein M065_2726 [Bacteroides fragilis str. Korea 419]
MAGFNTYLNFKKVPCEQSSVFSEIHPDNKKKKRKQII